MKSLKVEDWRSSDSGFKVIKAVNTTEWRMGDHLSEFEMDRILQRYGNNTVKVEIIPKS